MRKRDKKREKAKAEIREKKRKEVYVDVEIGEGGKRGKGHRQRVSSVFSDCSHGFRYAMGVYTRRRAGARLSSLSSPAAGGLRGTLSNATS